MTCNTSNTLKRKLSLLILFLFTLYIFSAVANWETVVLAFSGMLPPLLAARILLQMPLDVLRNSSIAISIFYFINAFLVAMYITTVFPLFRTEMRALKNTGAGFVGLIVGIFSVGCAACGSILTPVILLLGTGIPLSILSYANILLAVTSTILLSTALLLIKKHRASGI